MDRIKAPSWILWVLAGLSLVIAGLVTLHDKRDAQVAWITGGIAAFFFGFFAVWGTYQENVEQRIVAAFKRGQYLAHWVYADGPSRRNRKETYIGREGALYDGKFVCWHSLTARLMRVE